MTTFDKVYAAVRLIPRGSVATYGQIAAAIGNKRLARVVGYALHVNPEPGVGKTTTAQALVAGLAGKGYKVLGIASIPTTSLRMSTPRATVKPTRAACVGPARS